MNGYFVKCVDGISCSDLVLLVYQLMYNLIRVAQAAKTSQGGCSKYEIRLHLLAGGAHPRMISRATAQCKQTVSDR